MSAIEIAGLTYTRLPHAGEALTVEASHDPEGMTIVCVLGERATRFGERPCIAWDQIETPRQAERRATSWAKRRTLALAAVRHWRDAGHDVVVNIAD